MKTVFNARACSLYSRFVFNSMRLFSSFQKTREESQRTHGGEEISELTQAIAEIDASVAEARHSCRPAFAISNEYQMNLTLVAKCVFKIQIERGSFHATTTHFRWTRASAYRYVYYQIGFCIQIVSRSVPRLVVGSTPVELCDSKKRFKALGELYEIIFASCQLFVILHKRYAPYI